jgi:DNA-binding HxlR family transcriptional regulator
MMIRGFQTYKEFLASDERIATNILADRLRKLEGHGIITTQPDAADGRKLTYSLTPKGIDLAPVLAEMVLWAALHEETGNQALLHALPTNKQGVVSEVRERWAQKKSSPSELTKFRYKFIRLGVCPSGVCLAHMVQRAQKGGSWQHKSYLSTKPRGAKTPHSRTVLVQRLLRALTHRIMGICRRPSTPTSCSSSLRIRHAKNSKA